LIQFEHPAVLWLLPLALLPLLRGMRSAATRYPWLEVVPRDAWSAVIDWSLRLAGALAMAALVASLAGPYRGEERVERIGQGAEIVLVLDRSRSMDQEPGRGIAAERGQQTPGYSAQSKAAAAQRAVSEFVAQRPHDAFGLVLFSSYPIPFLPFTQRQEVIQAALAAGTVGRGLGDTDIARAVLAGAQYFDDRPYVGSRILLLISDGGARLDEEARVRIQAQLKKNRVGVYWLYLVGRWGRRLVLDRPVSEADRDALPEQSLHHYFSGLGLPYRVYQADDPAAVQQAIADMARVEQRPIQFSEVLPRRDLAPASLAVALAAVLVLLGSRALVVGRWA
jgi:mxaC protein